MTCEGNKKGCNNKILINTWMLVSMVCMLSVSDMLGSETHKPTDDDICKALRKKHKNINELLQAVFQNNSQNWNFSYYGFCNMCCCRNPMKFTFQYKQNSLFDTNMSFTKNEPYSFFDSVRDTYTLDPRTNTYSITNKNSNVLKLNGMQDILTDDLFSDKNTEVNIK